MDLELVEQALRVSLRRFNHPGRRLLEGCFRLLAELMQGGRIVQFVLSHTGFLQFPPNIRPLPHPETRRGTACC